MTDMRVKMYLDLVNHTKAGAAQAKRDLKGVKDAARDLDRTEAGKRLLDAFRWMAPAARSAAGNVRGVGTAVAGIGANGAVPRLTRDLDKARAAAARLKATFGGMVNLRGGDQGPGGPRAAAAQRIGMYPGIRSLAGGYIGARAVTQSVTKHAEAERAVTRIGVTADASKEALTDVGDTALRIAQEVAVPYAKVVQALETLVAQRGSLSEAMSLLPSVARTASAAGAEVEDIAKTADSVSANFKIAGVEMQKAFDIMQTGGKAGQFELRDMARYLPSLGPAAAAAGFAGEKGLSDLVAMLQVMRKGSGTAEEAASSLANVFQKMESEETAKRFKKFGVDLKAGMEKARKEGRNLVEVFEELTDQAIKGDLSKIPELFQDQELARGVRALRTFGGEWQRMSRTIQATAVGTVARDLAKVTDNVQARLDRLSNTFEKRWRQLGAVISDVVTPIDNKIDEITSGKNPRANVINERAGLVNADIIAREEMQSGQKGTYDPETRQRVDARKELLQRQAIDDGLAKLGQMIASKETALEALAQRTQGAGKARQDVLLAPGRKAVEALKLERDALVALVKARDEANLSLTENESTRKRLNTRMSGLPDEQPGPITPGLQTFGFGPEGQSKIKPPLPMPSQETYRTRDTENGPVVHRPIPLPPARPADLPQAIPTLKSLKDIFAPLMDTPALKAAGNRYRDDMRAKMEIDFGPDAMTLTQRLREGIEAGKGGVIGAANGLSSDIKSAVAGTDLTAAGQQAAASFAAGLRSGAPDVAAAAQSLVQQAQGGAARAARSRAIAGQPLHEGVT